MNYPPYGGGPPPGYGADPYGGAQVQPQPPQPPQPPPVHVCFTGSLACSGCNPCPDCRAIVQDRVLPVAMMAANLHEAASVIHDLVEALRARGMDPTMHLGVTIPPSLTSPQAMAQQFFRGYVDGWRRLHMAMQSEPELQGKFAITNLADLQVPPGAPPPFDHAQVQPSMSAQPQNMTQVPDPSMGMNGLAAKRYVMPPGMTIDPAVAAHLAQEEARHVAAAEEAKRRAAVRPMEAEEIAMTAAVPVNVPAATAAVLNGEAKNGSA